ncbi:hypothetical protein NVP2275O_190 [Vibrio phage 2.275.O._10N.286.54.E11]|nr:hypothetical protein NVP2275O_190 [Vibrio phage 2.275.O._10N.286.54.E11]
MKFYQIPVIFIEDSRDGNGSFSIDTYRFTEDNIFITISEDEMFDLTMLGAGFYGVLGLHIESKTVILGTAGDVSESAGECLGVPIYGPWGKNGQVWSTSNMLDWYEPTYPKLDNEETNKEHDISHMYDVLESRFQFAYKQLMIRVLNQFRQDVRDSDNSYENNIASSMGSSSVCRNYALEHVGNFLNTTLFKSVWYDMLYQTPEIYRIIEDLKTRISQQIKA